MRNCLLLTIFLFSCSIKADNIECPPKAIRSLDNKFCYIFNSTLSDFYGAESVCILRGGHLAYIDSAFTNAAVGGKFVLKCVFDTNCKKTQCGTRDIFNSLKKATMTGWPMGIAEKINF